MIERTSKDWYKDAVVYQLHIKAFFDSNDDGIGDFAGLMQKLDYIQSLGVTAIWLLPFYPSPLRDDGYDIADYRSINPSYGNMRDFRRFVKAAHDRGLRVITELVVNHTSDQHPWFQKARNAKPGSKARDFYVWSDTDQKYLETRIIFLDTEASNWAWDPVAQQYYWHRFYSHQPDLNYGNPRVVQEVVNVMHFWLDCGVDGLRLDAVPYLCVREGTNNENLPETHEVLKKIRADLETHYPDRMLLAEANMWPEDVKEYFGDGDECHMAFHFPLMPRMYMAIAQEDRHPITDIMRQTPEIPEGCQWAVFLRNHDELTLEMVTDNERDYLWSHYAGDRRMRINLGIRRRLAPLMENDRRKVELMNSLLLSMPGTPVVYYGDEIGMGDNIYLGDRDGVRTPMQWSPDRNGGFSKASPAGLYLPPIMDPIYGFDAVNVEAQSRSTSSLLNWTRRIIQVRQSRKSFGRGTLRFLYPGNRKVLAYLRQHEDETILCVVNLSRAAQPVELDLGEFRGRVPIELMGRTPFPPIGTLPYLLTLPGHHFYWFVLEQESAVPAWHADIPEPLPEYLTLVLRQTWNDLASGREANRLTGEVLPGYLATRRWFAAKDQKIAGVRIDGAVPIGDTSDGFLLARLAVELEGGSIQTYFLPLTTRWGEEAITTGAPTLPYTLAKVRRTAAIGALVDATVEPAFARAVVAAMRTGERMTGIGPDQHGAIRFTGTSRLENVEIAKDAEIRLLPVEQSNSSIGVSDIGILKALRRLAPGIHPEAEIGRFLTDVADFRNTPGLLGTVEHEAADGSTTTLAIFQEFVRNQGDGFAYTVEYLTRYLEDWRLLPENEREASDAVHTGYLAQAHTLGQRTAELHRAFATPTNEPAFAAEPFTGEDLDGLSALILRELDAALALLARARARLAAADEPSGVPAMTLEDASAIEIIDTFTGRADDLRGLVTRLAAEPVDTVKTRLHNDYHLGQVLVAQNDFYLIDFEGEPARTIDERRAKHTPLKDVAGMLRSFGYAAAVAAQRAAEDDAALASEILAEAREWQRLAANAFREAYDEHAAGMAGWPGSEGARSLIDLLLIEKALYEIHYEAANRPTWITIPVGGLLDLLAVYDEEEAGNDGSE